MTRLSKVVSIRLTPEEFAVVSTAAAGYGMTVSSFLRGVALADDAVPAMDFDDIPQYAKDILYGYQEGYRAALREKGS